MQILNAPSRIEIDKAHANLQSLEIGVPSTKNLRFLSPFKLICWLFLFFSSVPIHLFFNSAIFDTSLQGDDWTLTIATETFRQNTTFFPPGSSLAPAGSPGPVFDSAFYNDGGYGVQVALADYYDNSSGAVQSLRNTARDAKSWDRLEPTECLSEYGTCTPRTRYRDVVLVVETGTEDPSGWIPSQIYDSRYIRNNSSIWDRLVPSAETNPLWYSTQCSITMRSMNGCIHSCASALGLSSTDHLLAGDAKLSPDSNWTVIFRYPGNYYSRDFTFNDLNELKVRYCRAQPFTYKCKIGLSNPLILVVILCIIVKVTCCTIVVLRLPHTSLITSGDALTSFIANPNMTTTGLSSLGYPDSYRLEYSPRRPLLEVAAYTNLTSALTPRRWIDSTHRFISTVPRPVRVQTFTLWILSLIALLVCTIITYIIDDNSLYVFNPLMHLTIYHMAQYHISIFDFAKRLHFLSIVKEHLENLINWNLQSRTRRSIHIFAVCSLPTYHSSFYH